MFAGALSPERQASSKSAPTSAMAMAPAGEPRLSQHRVPGTAMDTDSPIDGRLLLTVVTYNVGAKDDIMFSSNRSPYLAVLERYFTSLQKDGRSHVICLQECVLVYLTLILEIASPP